MSYYVLPADKGVEKYEKHKPNSLELIQFHFIFFFIFRVCLICADSENGRFERLGICV